MAEITASMVKTLREETGQGMMECKKALLETDGDMAKAQELLRVKGAKVVDKKAGRATAEGLIGTYVHHNGKVAVMVEVQCETDFVARNPDFVEFVKDLAMHICAVHPKVVKREELDTEMLENEKRIYREAAIQEGKPEQIADKIADGKLGKFYSEVVLLEQPFVKDDKQTINELLTAQIAKLGENMSISRFARFAVGDK